jgi:chromate transporter
LGITFLRFGLTAFGGPAAHIAIFRRTFVTERQWLSADEFNRLLAVANVLPGPTSTELTLHIGYRHGGLRGLCIAGAAFIAPAVAATLALAAAFHAIAQEPLLFAASAGLQAAVAGLLLAVALDFVRPLQGGAAIGTALLAALAFAVGAPILLILAAAAAAFAGRQGALAAVFPFPSLLPAAAGSGSSLALVGAKFLQIGATLFGSGYVLFAYLDATFVKTGMLPEAALADAVAVGQITPGPLFSTAAYVGYLLHGFPGGIVAAMAIFAPSFVFVAFAGKFLDWADRHAGWKRALQGAAVASAGLLAGEAAVMAVRLPTAWQWGLAAVAFGLLRMRKVPVPAILIGGIAVGILLH